MALSSYKAEYIALKEAVKEQIWLESLYTQLAIGFTPGKLLTDSQLAIYLTKNPKYYTRTKYIDIQYYYMRKNISSGRIYLEYISSEKQLADGLTKAVNTEKFL